MKAARFEYVKPATLADALSALARDPDAAPLAGGQSLLAMMNMRLARPSRVVDIGGLAELQGVAFDGQTLRIGALTRHATLATSDEIANAGPMLRQAALELAHPAIRNRGTIGGSLALADPAAELPAVAMALDATLTAVGPDGAREISVADFFDGPYATALAPGELLKAIGVPVSTRRSAYLKLARRHGDYALAGVAMTTAIEDSALKDARIAVFAVSDRPVLATAAAAALEGQDPEDARAVDAAVAALSQNLEPLGQPGCSAATKLHLAGVALRRAIAQLAA